jgi:hypothetical protein
LSHPLNLFHSQAKPKAKPKDRNLHKDAPKTNEARMFTCLTVVSFSQSPLPQVDKDEFYMDLHEKGLEERSP